jgi:predicted metal-dependent phosphoesterase TrpH
MRIDLHTHSSASDGTDTPAALMAMAAAAGLDVIGLTDHDSTAGWAAAAAARPDGVTLIRGTEFSTRVEVDDRRVSVHLLGYLFDPADPAIVAEHRRLVTERLHRGLAMVELMTADGVPISSEQVLDIAAGAPVGRPHIGRALVQAGVVSSVTEAFDSYLAGPGSYYVPKVDTELAAAVQMIVAAGGAAVIAHPRARGEYRALTVEAIGRLADLGLAGLELDHPDHDAAGRAEIAEIARRFDLITTGSSDYHGHNKALSLGQQTTDPAALAGLVARSSGVIEPLGVT